MKNITQHTGKLSIVERLQNSYNGNPRYLISVGDVVCKTGVDSMHGYSIGNYEGCTVAAKIGTHRGVLSLCSIEKI